MPETSARIELPDGGTALIATSISADQAGFAPYSSEGRGAGLTLDALKKSLHGAMQVAQVLKSEFEAAFPDVIEAEIRFGVSLEGKLDAKIVAASAAATFDITIKVSR